MGDIDFQSIAGAISTGTHGTGLHFGTMSTQVEGLTLVTATGDLLECSPEHNPAIFKAAQVSLGTLGIIAKVKLRVIPAKRMHYQGYRKPLADCLSTILSNTDRKMPILNSSGSPIPKGCRANLSMRQQPRSVKAASGAHLIRLCSKMASTGCFLKLAGCFLSFCKRPVPYSAQ